MYVQIRSDSKCLKFEIPRVAVGVCPIQRLAIFQTRFQPCRCASIDSVLFRWRAVSDSQRVFSCKFQVLPFIRWSGRDFPEPTLHDTWENAPEAFPNCCEIPFLFFCSCCAPLLFPSFCLPSPLCLFRFIELGRLFEKINFATVWI